MRYQLRGLKWIVLAVLCYSGTMYAQQKTNVYLFSGLGSDVRVFSGMKWDSSRYEFHYLPQIMPERRERMAPYARRMAAAIDSTAPFMLVGVSLGGMISVEMSKFIHPEKVFILASAKTRAELPLRYKFQKYVPLYRMVPAGFLKSASFIAQPLFEPDRKAHKETFIAMLKARNPKMLQRSIGMIVHWDNQTIPANVIHIHGKHDHTLPLRNIENAIVLEHCSHMMALVCADDISELIRVHTK